MGGRQNIRVKGGEYKVLERVTRFGLPEKMHMSKHLKKPENLTMQIAEEILFQAEGTVSTKALRQEHV